jgi:hypothetical protein
VDGLDEERRESLHRDWCAYFDQFRKNGQLIQPRPYVLVIGTRR